MTWTKQQLIEQALEELGISAAVYDVQPEQLESARRVLDSQMASWESRGVHVSYNLEGDLSAESDIPDQVVEAVYCALAIRLAPRFGKTPSSETHQAADAGWQALLGVSAMPREMQPPGNMPRGAGYKPRLNVGRIFTPRPDNNPLQSTPGGDLGILSEGV